MRIYLESIKTIIDFKINSVLIDQNLYNYINGNNKSIYFIFILRNSTGDFRYHKDIFLQLLREYSNLNKKNKIYFLFSDIILNIADII